MAVMEEGNPARSFALPHLRRGSPVCVEGTSRLYRDLAAFGRQTHSAALYPAPKLHRAIGSGGAWFPARRSGRTRVPLINSRESAQPLLWPHVLNTSDEAFNEYPCAPPFPERPRLCLLSLDWSGEPF